MKRKRNKLFPILLALAVGGALAYSFRPQPQDVDAGLVDQGPMDTSIREDGKTRIREIYKVSAPLAGKLERITFEAGDSIKETDVLAVIVPSDPELLDPRARAQAEARVRTAEAAKKQTRAQLDRARVAHEYAQITLDRVAKLHAKDALSKQELDDAEQNARATEDTLRAAEFAEEVAAYELEQAQAVLIRANDPAAAGKEWRHEVHPPISGRILRVLEESAVVVNPGAELAEVGDPNDLEVEVDVLSSDAVMIRPGSRAMLEHWGGEKPLEGRVRLIEPSGFTKVSALGVEEQRVNVIIDFTGPQDERARMGDAYRVEARIVTWETESALRVPSSALFRENQKWAVFVIDQGTAKLKLVGIGRMNETHAEVLDGLSAGDQVVVYPGDRIKDGVSIRVRK